MRRNTIMATATLNVYSYTLGMNTDVGLIFPERRIQPHVPLGGKKFKVLYLLHGHAQDHTSWMRNSRIEWYLRDQDVVVVMPSANRGWYTDGKYTHRYFTYLTEELPTIIKNWFAVSDRREDTYIAGLSMGGYGSLRAGLNCPEKYAYVASLSGGISPYGVRRDIRPGITYDPAAEDMDKSIEAVFGSREEFENSTGNLYKAAKRLNESNIKKPVYYLCCGKGDFIFEQNNEFAAFVKREAPNLDLKYEVSEGVHDWDFWDREIVTVLKFFGLLPKDFVRK
jgi:S-formylglutathione hydrolase FrmB